jgi:cell pole-organizing protein PopZ
MSALPSPLQNPHGSADSAADPSMEEILASIRRIIADDHGTPITPRPSRPTLPPTATAQEPARPVLRAPEIVSPLREPERRMPALPDEPAPPRDLLREPALRREPPHEVAAARVRGALRSDEERASPSEDRSPDAQPMRPAPSGPAPGFANPSAPPSVDSGQTLLSPLAQASVTSAFEALTVSMAAQNTSMVEDAVRDMLRPMLKQWLDDNLPTIVERLVRAEIERVARGGRS